MCPIKRPANFLPARPCVSAFFLMSHTEDRQHVAALRPLPSVFREFPSLEAKILQLQDSDTRRCCVQAQKQTSARIYHITCRINGLWRGGGNIKD